MDGFKRQPLSDFDIKMLAQIEAQKKAELVANANAISPQPADINQSAFIKRPIDNAQMAIDDENRRRQLGANPLGAIGSMFRKWL